jgi:Mib_herc2
MLKISIWISSMPSMSIGEKILRGPHWRYGNQDGGVGSVGSIIDITDWGGFKNACVRQNLICLKTQFNPKL